MMEREPFDIKDYRQRLRDRTTDHELLLDGARVEMELVRLREKLDISRVDAEEYCEENARLREMNERVDEARLKALRYGTKKARELARLREEVEAAEGRAVRAEAEADRLREERDRLKNRVAEDDGIIAENVRLNGIAVSATERLEKCQQEYARLREENMRLQGRLAAVQDHHDAEHEKCARDALKEIT